MKKENMTENKMAKVYDSLQGESIFEGTRAECDQYLAKLKVAYPKYQYFFVQND